MITGNAFVGQSGGPTAVINSSLAGVINAALKSLNIDKIYGLKHGIDGVLNEKFIDLNEKFCDKSQLELLRHTPASFLGSCRTRLSDEFDETYEKIFNVFKKYNIKFFFYIGGNDSMDTVLKLSQYAKHIDFPISIIGVPKTIDNDLCLTDHTPGYGSAAKFIATAVREVSCDATVYDTNSVTIIEIMGRNAGWLTAAAALARSKTQPAPHLIYLPEVAFDKENFISDLIETSKTHKNIIVAVSEGLKDSEDKYICEGSVVGLVDSFGHIQLSGAAENLAALVKKRLGWKVRGMEINLLQRCGAHLASKTDNDEAFLAGTKAVEAALNGHSGCMVYFKRVSNSPYKTETDLIEIEKVANFAKTVPIEWITKEHNDVTKQCIEYITPLIQGEIDIKYENGVPVFLDR